MIVRVFARITRRRYGRGSGDGEVNIVKFI